MAEPDEIQELAYQHEGANWLSQRRYALLADEMGLGKTAQAVIAADRACLRTALVLGPASSTIKWGREWQRFSLWGDRQISVMQTGRDEPAPEGVTICSYSLANQPNVLKKLMDIHPDVIVFDESHFLKNPEAQRTIKMLSRDGLVQTAKRAWAISGTPAPNHYGELWLLLHVFGVYPHKYESFVRRFCKGYRSPHGFKITGSQNAEQLRPLLSKIMLRRKMDDVMSELPKIQFTEHVLKAGDIDEHMWFPEFDYDPCKRADMKDQMHMLESIVRDESMTMEQRLTQLEKIFKSVASARKWIGLSKVLPYAGLIHDELMSGLDKIVIFAMHRDVIEALAYELKAYSPLVVYGGTAQKKRQKRVDKFQNSLSHRVFIGQVVAAGTAIDLTAAHRLDFVEASWVPGENLQAAMRVRRIGQTRPVTARFITLQGTVDEPVQRAHRNKLKDMEKLMDD